MKRAKKMAACFISFIAMAVAVNSSSMCLGFIFDEPEMPKSLIKTD